MNHSGIVYFDGKVSLGWREIEILEFVVDGYSNKAVAAAMKITEGSAKVALAIIVRKCQFPHDPNRPSRWLVIQWWLANRHRIAHRKVA